MGFYGKGNDGIDLPFGIEPEVSVCRTCGKEFREKFTTRNIDGEKLKGGGGFMLDGSDRLAVHEMQEHGKFGDDDVKGNISARHGFSGTVSKKTKFTVGEGNKKEFVSRKKVNVFDVNGMFSKSKSKKKSNNIFGMGGF